MPSHDRLLDIIIAAVCLVALSPLLLIVAVAVKLNSPSAPILIRARVPGVKFSVLQFRPMSGRFGDVLRRTEIAEVPLLFNILAGEVLIDWLAVLKGSVRPMPREDFEKIDAEAQDLIRRLSLQTNAARRNRHRELGPMPVETISTADMAR